MNDNPALDALRHHVSGAVARGEAEPVYEIAPAGDALTGECPGCGQLSPYDERCPNCRAEERRPQGTQDALFVPGAPQIAGQLTIG
jgi:hypothetical protein